MELYAGRKALYEHENASAPSPVAATNEDEEFEAAMESNLDDVRGHNDDGNAERDAGAGNSFSQYCNLIVTFHFSNFSFRYSNSTYQSLKQHHR